MLQSRIWISPPPYEVVVDLSLPAAKRRRFNAAMEAGLSAPSDRASAAPPDAESVGDLVGLQATIVVEESLVHKAPPANEEPKSSGNTVKEKRRRSKLPDKSEMVCAVCGASASGHNFGAITCESCKAFFRRSALKDKIAPCEFTNDCKIDEHTRKFCASCRLAKCYAAEMKKEWILNRESLMKRKPINKKTKDTQGASTSASAKGQAGKGTDDADKLPQPLTDANREEIEFILAEHKSIDAAYFATPEADVNDRGFTVDTEEFAKLSSEPTQMPDVLNMVSGFITRFIPFLKKLAPFSALSVDDRICLLTQCIDETMALRSAIQYDPKIEGFSVTDGESGEHSSLQLEIIKTMFGEEVYTEHLKLITSFNTAAQWDKPTMILTMIINLFASDRMGVQSREKVGEAEEHYVQLLHAYLKSKENPKNASIVFPRLLMILTQVRAYAEVSRKSIQQVNTTRGGVSSLEPIIKALLLYGSGETD